jgi:hypothetical protein
MLHALVSLPSTIPTIYDTSSGSFFEFEAPRILFKADLGGALRTAVRSDLVVASIAVTLNSLDDVK